MADFGLLLDIRNDHINVQIVTFVPFCSKFNRLCRKQFYHFKGVVGREGAFWDRLGGVKLTPCDCCNANRSLSLYLSLTLALCLWSGCHFYLPAYPETQNVHIPQKNGFVLCYSCPDYDKYDELGPDAAATCTVEARIRRNMRTNGREWHGWADTTPRSWQW